MAARSTDHVIKTRYSGQHIVCLDPGETYVLHLKDGSDREIRLVSVGEYRDHVMDRVRRADARVEINGQPLALHCAPYVMPAEIAGIRIQADTTSQWVELPKRVQLSIWDAADPIVDTHKLRFPMPAYRLFSHGTQSYNEVVHLGTRDDTPAGPKQYHNYGEDWAGYEGTEEIVCCADGEVVRVGDWSVCIEDPDGFIWDYCHFDSIAPSLKVGDQVKQGHALGILGKTGPSGRFSHLHVGTYISPEHLQADQMNRRLNLYPWFITAYEAEFKHHLYAVARPHQLALTGEKVVLDGRNSLSFGSRIVSYRWEFHDGQTVSAPVAERTYPSPGTYAAALWVQDESGAEDVDFCTVKVFTEHAPENHVPTIFMTHTPTAAVLPGQPVRFRCWLQKPDAEETMTIDFGDGTRIEKYESFSELDHTFRKPGIHIVTASTNVDGLPITQKQKVVVSRPEL